MSDIVSLPSACHSGRANFVRRAALFGRLASRLVGALLAVASLNATAGGAGVVIPLDPQALSWIVPVRVMNDADALGGTYVVLPAPPAAGNAGSARVQLPRTGDYYVWGRVRAVRGAGRAFDIELGGARYRWAIAAPSRWHWERVVHADGAGATTPVVLAVEKPGAYTFKLLPRESGASIDEFLITNDLYLAPVDHPQR